MKIVHPIETFKWFEEENVEFINESAVNLKIESCNLIVSYYTLQFIHPSTRQELFNKIFNSLNWGGGFIFFEKVRAPDARFQDMMSLIYNDFKMEQGYDANEIIQKSKSLNVYNISKVYLFLNFKNPQVLY